MNQPKTEQQKFLDQFQAPNDNDPFAQFNTPNSEEEGEKKGEEGEGGEKSEEQKEADEQELRNRRERRLAAKLEAERKSAMELAELLRQERERNSSRERETDSDYIKSVERIYGTDTPEAKEATEILKNTLKGLESSARKAALEDFKEIQRQEREAERKAAEELNNMLEELEDDYKVDLTGNTQARQNFLKLLEKMSPKDEHGQITQYADHHAVYEIFKTQSTQKPNTKAREIANRSMTQSGQSATGNQASPHGDLDEATVKYLIEHDLI